MGADPNPQLYNLANDIGEKKNLATEHPDKVKEMMATIEKLRSKGHSRP